MVGKSRVGNDPDTPDQPLMDSLVAAHPEPFALIDENFTIVACNQAYAEAYTNLEPEQIVGKKCHEVSHKSLDRCELHGDECPLEKVLAANAPVQVIHRHLDHANKPYFVSVRGYPVRNGSTGKRYVGEAMAPISREEELAFTGETLVGTSPIFLSLLEHLQLVAKSDLPVLIEGETGTGKELAASFLHRKSLRATGPFVIIDCTTLSDELFVAELFGHESGAFTGCAGMKRGLVEMADGGTLFLDEIGEISAEIQAKLLRLLDRSTFRRLGSNQDRKVDFRLICATNRDLAAEVSAGRFRSDLYFRINSIPVTLPPLRERPEDIPSLATFFLEQTVPKKLGSPISPAAIALLQCYPFPGNIRELRHALERAALMAQYQQIDVPHLPPEIRCRDGHTLDDKKSAVSAELDSFDSKVLRSALERFRGNRRKTAAFLKISERTLYRRLRDLDRSTEHN